MKRALVVAVLLHVAVALWILRGHAPSRPSEEQRAPVSEPVAIELEPSEPLVTPPRIAGEGAPFGAEPVRESEPRGASQERAPSLEGRPSGDDDGAIVIATGSGMSAPTGDIHGGFAAYSNRDSTPATDEAKERAPESLSERGARAVRDALYAHDRSVGMGAEGPVVSALETAAYSSTAPVNGGAVFEITIGADGMVASITTASPEWRSVADEARRAAKRARVPGSARGVVIKIEITSAVLLASGHSPTAKVDLGGVPLTKGGDAKSPSVSILNPIPKIGVTPIDREGKVLVPSVSVDVFSTNIDPTDLTPRPRRVIAAKVIDEHLL